MHTNEVSLPTDGSSDSTHIPTNGKTVDKGSHWIPKEWLVHRQDVEPWPAPVNGKELLDEIVGAVQRIVVLGDWAREALTLWVVHTYAFELRDVSTYLGIESPEHRCGKSTLLDVLGRLVNHPVRTANISPPALFRVIAETKPALLIDEADTFLRSDELKGILNSGYHREGAFVMRVTYELSNSETAPAQSAGNTGLGRLVKFSCWCPKAIAQIGHLPHTLADRCIRLVMQRKLPDEQRERLQTLRPLALTLKRKCARFVLDHADDIRNAQPLVPECLNDRASDIWEPLLVLADLAGGDWPERARKAAVALSAKAQESDPLGSLLMDILELFLRSQNNRVFSKDLVAWFNLTDDRPWMVLKRGKKVTSQWVAQHLLVFGIRPKTIRIGDARAKGYEMDDFKEAFRRYIPKAEIETFRAEIQEERALTVELEKAKESRRQAPDAAVVSSAPHEHKQDSTNSVSPPRPKFNPVGALKQAYKAMEKVHAFEQKFKSAPQ